MKPREAMFCTFGIFVCLAGIVGLFYIDRVNTGNNLSSKPDKTYKTYMEVSGEIIQSVANKLLDSEKEKEIFLHHHPLWCGAVIDKKLLESIERLEQRVIVLENKEIKKE